MAIRVHATRPPAGRVLAEAFIGDYGQDDARADAPPRPVGARALSGGSVVADR